MEYLIHCGYLVPMTNNKILKDYCVVTEDDRIIDIAPYEKARGKYRGYEIIDATDSIVLPGLVNLHTHAAMSILRGYADDLPLHIWLKEKIWPLEAKLTPRDIYYGAVLAAAESALMGTTVINTMYHYTDPELNEANAISNVGLRAVVGHVCFSWRKEDDRRCIDSLVKKWHGGKNGLVKVSIDPHSPYTVDPDYLKELRIITDEYNERYLEKGIITYHIHVAETKDEAKMIEEAFKVKVDRGIFTYLDSLNILKDDTVAAHCIWLSKDDIAILSKRKVSVAHNPVSNLKLASGIAPIPELTKNGVNVGLGTDSACSNNSLDMFETMKLAALLHKGINGDPTLLPAWEVLRMATINGVKALKWDKELGTIEIGKKADLIAIQYKGKPHLSPIYDPISHLVYAVRSLDVKYVIVNGNLIVEAGKLKTINLSDILDKVNKIKEELLSR